MQMEFDTAVKLNIYETIARTTQSPTTRDVAQGLGAPLAEVQAAFERLHKQRLLVPEPGDPSRIRMAPPFSGVATPFPVKVHDKLYYANCAWDALGIPAALHENALVEAADGHSGQPIRLEVRDGQPIPEPCVIHFAVPAARWWDDIIFT
jgi:DNA-binding transcriptional MocR family regulator